MAAETYSWSPKKLIAGHDPDVITETGTLVSGQNLAAGTPLAWDTNGKLYAHPGIVTSYAASTSAGSPTIAFDATFPVAGILMHDINASTSTVNNNGSTVVAGTATDTAITYYSAGNFFADQIQFYQNGNGSAAGTATAGVSTNILKQKFFAQSKIVLTFQDTGEV